MEIIKYIMLSIISFVLIGYFLCIIPIFSDKSETEYELKENLKSCFVISAFLVVIFWFMRFIS